MSDEEFEQCVDDALGSIPPDLSNQVSDVALVIEDEPPAGHPDLLGLYEGVPLTERDSGWAGALPDKISIYRGPILRFCHTRQEAVEQIYITVLHEIGHYFGIDDDRLHELGWA